MLSKTKDMLDAVNKLAEEPQVKEATEQQAVTPEAPKPIVKSDPAAGPAPSKADASTAITSSTNAKEIADLIQAEIKSKEQPKPAAKENNLKNEIADMISKSLAQHSI